MPDVEKLTHKLRNLAIDAVFGVTKEDKVKLEDILKALREEYKRGKFSDDAVAEIVSLKDRIKDTEQLIKEGKLKKKPNPTFKTNPKDNVTFCPKCDLKTLKVSHRKYGQTWGNCSACGYNDTVKFF